MCAPSVQTGSGWVQLSSVSAKLQLKKFSSRPARCEQHGHRWQRLPKCYTACCTSLTQTNDVLQWYSLYQLPLSHKSHICPGRKRHTTSHCPKPLSSNWLVFRCHLLNTGENFRELISWSILENRTINFDIFLSNSETCVLIRICFYAEIRSEKDLTNFYLLPHLTSDEKWREE